MTPQPDEVGHALACQPAGRPGLFNCGLDASNVAEAVTIAHPWGVDACSRIETSPGKKDHQKMQAFIHAARKALQS
jgi:phosphoribosylanthranilate isomerase